MESTCQRRYRLVTTNSSAADLAKLQLPLQGPAVQEASALSTTCRSSTATASGSDRKVNIPPGSDASSSLQAALPQLSLFASSSTEHDRIKRQVQYWFRLGSLKDVDLALGPDTQVLAIAGDAVLKFQIVNRLFKHSCYTSSAKALHEESQKYITNKQLACVVAWKLDLHKLLRIYNFMPTAPSKIAVKRLGTAVEALIGVLALQQPGDSERVIGQIFSMIGRESSTREGSPAVARLLQLQQSSYTDIPETVA